MNFKINKMGIFKKIFCKLLHIDERFIDTSGCIDRHLVCLGHKCFNNSLLIKKFWFENEFKEKIE